MVDQRLSYASSDIDLSLDIDILKRLLSEPMFSQSSMTPSNGTWSRTMGEDTVDARLAHAVVAFWVDQKPHVGVQVSGCFANRADLYERFRSAR